ncbi:hypothetical protein EON81_24345 [bacterium]|nr:MAG: hypothetical protein EON81_24345 [bacterium]
MSFLPLLPLEPTPRERIRAVAEEYGIEVRIVEAPVKFQREGYSVSAEPVSDETLRDYAPLFEREWRRYPRTLMVRTKLGRIVLGSKVAVQDQPRAAVPEFVPGWLWLDADRAAKNPRYGRHVLHHDYFHMIDEWDSPDRRLDAAWEALNPVGVKYGKGGWFMQKGNPGASRTDLPGFVNEYSTSAVEEDKAEIYSYLLDNPAFLAERVKADPVIAAKATRIKALVKALEPAMDEAWFTKNAE